MSVHVPNQRNIAPLTGADRPAVTDPSQTSRLRLRHHHIVLVAILLVAFGQGLLYLFLLPPWQHYDEPTHFEYAWLIANRPDLPQPRDTDQVIRREIAASMLEHNFYHNLPRPFLLTDDQEIWIGYSQLNDPPAYYVLVSLPLRLVRHLDVTTQLYVARSVSLLLFLATIAITIAMMRDMTPDGHALRWAVPLGLVLLPAFVDIMTAVNNDVGAVFVFTLFLWGAVRAIRFGLTRWRLIWIVGTAGLAVLTKNTTAVALLLAPLALLLAVWIQRGWSWRWFAGLLGGGAVIAAVGVFGWGDAAFWYRKNYISVNYKPTRGADISAPVGAHAVVLTTSHEGRGQVLVNPLLEPDVQSLAGHTVTVGGWVWANQTTNASVFGLQLKVPGETQIETVSRRITLTPTPTFVSWTFAVPAETRILQYFFLAQPPNDEDRPLQVFLDGAVLVKGAFPEDTAPVFDNAGAQTGVWAGTRFTNLVRNASAELGWPYARAWFHQMIVDYTRRSPTSLVATLFDVERTWEIVSQRGAFLPFDSFVVTFAWGHVRLSDPLWLYLYRSVALVSLVGCAIWFVRHARHASVALRAILVLFALVALLVWGNTFLRPFPMLDGVFVLPAARYAFPAILPTMLVLIGGWWALWPKTMRNGGTLIIIAGLLVLNLAAIRTIWLFYQALFAA